MRPPSEPDAVNERLSATYKAGFDDISTAIRATAHPLAVWALITLLPTLVIVLGGGVGDVKPLLGLVMVSLAILGIWLGWVMNRAQIRYFGEGKDHFDVTVDVDHATLTIGTDWRSSSIKLDRFSGYRIDEMAIVLFVQERLSLLIPRSKVDSDFVEALVARLAGAGVQPVAGGLSWLHRITRVFMILLLVIILLLSVY